MTMVPRFFVTVGCAVGSDVDLDDDASHHLANVLRAREGDAIITVDASGSWNARIIAVSTSGVRVRVESRADEEGGELPVEIAVLQAITKGSRFDDVVEKTVELGARRIVPVKCARSYGEATRHRVERWRRIARAAAEQSRRRSLPIVEDTMIWNDAIATFARSMPVVVGWERSPKGSLAQAIGHIRNEKSFGIAVGPEGSLTDDELDVARAAGCSFVWLGPTILRTDTAAAAMIAALASGCGWW